MGHQLESNNDFASRGQMAWHRLGTVFPQDKFISAAEMAELSNTAFEVVKSRNYVERPLSSIDEFLQSFGEVEVSDIPNILTKYKEQTFQKSESFSTVRSDNGHILGTVGERYEVLQNFEMYDFLEQFRAENNFVQYETAGCLQGGKVVFVSAKIPSELVVGKDDKVDEYLLFTNSFDGSGTLRILWTPVRTVCANTLGMALNSAEKATNLKVSSTGHFACNHVSIKHTKNMRKPLAEANKFLGLITNSTANLNGLMNTMLNTRISDKTHMNLLIDLFVTDAQKKVDLQKGANLADVLSTRTVNKIGKYRDAYFNGIGQKGIIGTAYGYYNGVTLMTSHHSAFAQDSTKHPEQHFKNNVMGNATTLTASKAWTQSLNLINN